MSPGAQIVAQNGSSILEIEQGKVDQSETGTSDTDDSPGLPDRSSHPVLQSSPAQEPVVAPYSGDASSTPVQAEPQITEPSNRIPRNIVPEPAQDDSVQSGSQVNDGNDGTPVEIRKADDEPPPSKEKKSSKKQNSKKSKVKKALGKEDSGMPPVAPAIKTSTQPVEVKAPVTKASAEEAMLARLVRELEFGTLLNSISLLNQLVSTYPEDPDYTSLLAMAIRLRDGDVWYQYSRKVDMKEDKAAKPSAPVQIMKPTSNESVNELKKSSWFLIRSVKR